MVSKVYFIQSSSKWRRLRAASPRLLRQKGQKSRTLTLKSLQKLQKLNMKLVAPFLTIIEIHQVTKSLDFKGPVKFFSFVLHLENPKWRPRPSALAGQNWLGRAEKAVPFYCESLPESCFCFDYSNVFSAKFP